MFRRDQFDYWDPYKDEKTGSRNRFSPPYQYHNTMRRVSNEKKIGNIIITSSNSKERKKIFQVKSSSKDKQSNDQAKPRMFVISNQYFVQRKEDRSKSPPSHLEYRNRRLEIIPEASNTTVVSRKSPLKIIKKSPPKIEPIDVPREMVINTTVTAPSSVASSMLNNFETNPDRLLGNMTESNLDKVFKI